MIQESTKVYQIAGSLESSPGSSPDLSGNMNVRHVRQRSLYNRLLVGDARRSEVGQLTGSGSDPKATPPSWTQHNVGLRQAFTQGPLSSSRHEVSNLNTFFSGTRSVENTDNSQTLPLYYSKQGQLKRIVYSVTSSAGLSLSTETTPSTIEYPVRTTFNLVSGTYVNTSYFNPASIDIYVSEYGKIRDVRVWVEFIHDHRGGTGIEVTGSTNPFWSGGIGTSFGDLKQGLQGVQIALRSPNVSFKYAHPLWNDPRTWNFEKWPASYFGTPLSQKYRDVPELMKSSYLLWAGHACENDLGTVSGSNSGSSVGSTFVSATIQNINMSEAGIVGYAYDAVSHVDHVIHTSGGLRYYKRNQDGTTNYDIVDVNAIAGSNIRIDSSHNPHISERRTISGTNYVYHAFMSSSTWISSLISSGSEPWLALDPGSGEPVISYSDRGAGRIYFARSVSGSWTTQIVSTRVTGSNTYSEFDPNGLPVIAYASGTTSALSTTDSNLVLVRSGTSGWVRETVDTTIGNPTYVYPNVLFVNNVPTVVYARSPYYTTFDEFNNPITVPSDPEIVIARSGTTGWTKQVIFSSSSFVTTRVSCRTRNGEIHLGIVSGSQAWYVLSGALGVSAAPVDTSQYVQDVCIDLDENGYPRVASIGQTSVKLAQKGQNSLFFNFSPGSYAEYDTDIDMRTIFTDSARTPNPRHLSHLYGGTNPDLLVNSIRIGRYASPHSGSVTLFNLGSLSTDFSAQSASFLTGCNFPWMLDSRVPPGNFVGKNYSVLANGTATSSLSVPSGWLSGQSGTAAPGEFQTYGMQLGPGTIKPVYPLLDDVYVEKTYDETHALPPESTRNGHLLGFRPGLRGSEVHGQWSLLIGTKAEVNSVTNIIASSRGGIWFRQFRLEFLIDSGASPFDQAPSRQRRFKKAGNVNQRPGRSIVQVISGSASWDAGINRVYVQGEEDYGRTVGITDNTGSARDSFAVFSRVTGSLSVFGNSISRTYLKNEFGTPFIPISSGSGIPSSFDPFSDYDSSQTRQIMRTLDPRDQVNSANRMNDFVSRVGDTSTTRDRVENIVADSQD